MALGAACHTRLAAAAGAGTLAGRAGGLRAATAAPGRPVVANAAALAPLAVARGPHAQVQLGAAPGASQAPPAQHAVAAA